MNSSIQLSCAVTNKQLKRFSDFNTGQCSLWNRAVWGPGSTLPVSVFTLKSERRERRGRTLITQLASDLDLKVLAQTGLMASLQSLLTQIWWEAKELVLFFSSGCLSRQTSAVYWSSINVCTYMGGASVYLSIWKCVCVLVSQDCTKNKVRLFFVFVLRY